MRKVERLEAAAHLVISARDHHAEHGAYPDGTVLSDQHFDDWAAEVLDRALNPRAVTGGPLRARTEDPPPYIARLPAPATRDEENVLIEKALDILRSRAPYGPMRSLLSGPADAKDYVMLSFSGLDALREHFVVTYLDAQHQVLRTEVAFSGTLSQTSVYPREIVRHALTYGAAAVVFAHNHPSGSAEPSRADEFLTQTLKQALALVDVRVLDHFIITPGGAVMSFAERGLL